VGPVLVRTQCALSGKKCVKMPGNMDLHKQRSKKPWLKTWSETHRDEQQLRGMCENASFTFEQNEKHTDTQTRTTYYPIVLLEESCNAPVQPRVLSRSCNFLDPGHRRSASWPLE
jgi:hypothetical protein